MANAAAPVHVAVERLIFHGTPGIVVAASVPSSASGDLEALFDALDRALEGRSLRRADVVRNRLFGASRHGRDAASAYRFARFRGPARCATSSYIDVERFPSGDGVRIETTALEGAGEGKLSVEYEPPQPPCRLVATGRLVFLSGLTSTDSGFARQVDAIRARLVETLRLAEDRLGRAVQPTHAAAWVHRTVAGSDLEGLAERAGLAGLDVAIERVDGYSKPGKLIELEVDAILDR